MLRTTDPQLENLMYLRDVVIPWMENALIAERMAALEVPA